ncbi:ABC transporter substrate-binding protein [Magnetospira sp. QH-2]|uniref:ABC transporter substrate-binding protein n=1 Tax=Magnetospira sp. (strain QH-2) TaxID=1288970 RepID=UPI0003E8109B|nr:ABC transporter substrate-binding protein [Magnetospira sp. QH-2]CCQ73671.1 Putative peptide transporter subunit: periplasmic-binding component of ABC superfamily [Magnetospira sp. QH-2]
MMSLRTMLRSMVFTTGALIVSAPVLAADLVVGIASEPSSIDPHYHNLGPNNSAARNVYDRLIHMDAKMQLKPALAVSWKATDDTTWEVKLRQGVSFHDGTPLTAADVVFTFDRIPHVPNSPSAFTKFSKTFVSVEAVDDYTLRIKTKGRQPLTPNNLAQVSIVSKETVEAYYAANSSIAKDVLSIDSSHFNSGKLAVGTGPYKLTSWKPGEAMKLQANESYWGGVPDYKIVEMRPLKNDAARLAALQSGDVDIIDGVPTADLKNMQADSKYTLFKQPSNLAIYLHMDSNRSDSPHITAKDGGKIKNPLLDVRVRKAISMALNREGIVARIMDEAAAPASQMLPKGFSGVSGKLSPVAYDVKGAKKLLAEAGYGDGFKMIINAPNDRYVNDEQIAQAIAQLLARIGIEMSVQTEPKATYFKNASALKYSFMLLGWGSSTGEQGSTLMSLLHTYKKEAGQGTSNRGRFSDAKVDSMLEDAMADVDEASRSEKIAMVAERAIGELYGVIPVHYQMNFWAARKGVIYAPRADNYTVISEMTR